MLAKIIIVKPRTKKESDYNREQNLYLNKNSVFYNITLQSTDICEFKIDIKKLKKKILFYTQNLSYLCFPTIHSFGKISFKSYKFRITQDL